MKTTPPRLNQAASPPQRYAAWLWLLVVLLCLAFTALRVLDRPSFDSSILALLPGEERDPGIDVANRAMTDHFSNHLLFLVGSPAADDEELRHLTGQLREHLLLSEQFDSVSTGPDPALERQLREFYLPYRYQLLSAHDRAQLGEQRQQKLQDRAVANLYSPAALPRIASVIEDPLNLLGQWLQSLRLGEQGFQLDSWGLKAEDDRYRYRVLSAHFTGKPFDLDTQQRILAAVNPLSAMVDSATLASDQEFVLLRSGLIFHAAAGARQARHEISTIGLGATALIIALLFWHFRRFTTVLLPMLSIATGILVATAGTLAVFGRIHLVTLAFGASLVGVSLDYALHFLCRRAGSGSDTLKAIFPGILLGLVSSVLAYAAQALTPFPGLQQIAIFSCAGLIGSWLTVVCWFPRLPFTEKRASNRLLSALGSLSRYRWLLIVALGGLAIAAAQGFQQMRFKDALQLLQNTPPQLLQSESKIQSLSNRTGSGRYLLLRAQNSEALLRLEESLAGELDRLVAQGRLQSYQALSRFLPSRQVQVENHQLIARHVYGDPGFLDTFFRRLGAPADTSDRAREAFPGQLQQWLTTSAWSAGPLHPLFPYLWLGDAPGDGGVTSTIGLGAVTDPAAYAILEQLATRQPGVVFVDRITETSSLLARYRVKVSQWLAIAYTGLAALLWWRYRGSSVRILAPPLVATLMTFGLLSFADQPLNLFNTLAALLILGIGLDSGIFLRESNGEPHCWEAITLAGITTLCAFGLLAWSDTPVLHHFGLTVLIGISLTWLIIFTTGFRAGYEFRTEH